MLVRTSTNASSAKLRTLFNIINIQICHKVYVTICVFVVNSSKFAPTIVSLYMVFMSTTVKCCNS